MFLGNLGFFVGEACSGIRRRFLVSMISVGTITIALIVFGAFLLGTVNLRQIVYSIGSKVEISAYVDDDLDEEKTKAIAWRLSQISGVSDVKFISKKEAWQKFKQDYQRSLDLASVVEGNPLPHTFVVKVKNPELIHGVAQKVAALSQIDEVRYSGQFAERLQTFVNMLNVGGTGLVVLLGIATLLIVVNTIRLTVIARQDEIEIMQLVGATATFIKGPFIFEGILIGLFGAVFSVSILKFAYDAIISRIASALPFLPFVTSSKMLGVIYAIVGLAGAFLGMFGAYISVSRTIRE